MQTETCEIMVNLTDEQIKEKEKKISENVRKIFLLKNNKQLLSIDIKKVEKEVEKLSEEVEYKQGKINAIIYYNDPEIGLKTFRDEDGNLIKQEEMGEYEQNQYPPELFPEEKENYKLSAEIESVEINGVDATHLFKDVDNKKPF